jgi:transcriptional regulator with XRE-family HTH domain
MNSFAEYLNSLIRDHPEGVSSLAQKAKISRPSLYDIINGKTLPRLTTLDNLFTALNLPENTFKKLKDAYQSERLKYSKKGQNHYLKDKKKLLSEISSLLLSKGHEISRPSEIQDADLILRIKTNRIPIVISPALFEHCTYFGRLLKLMYNLSAEKGYICTTKLSSQDRSYQPFFSKYGVKILSLNNLLRELG